MRAPPTLIRRGGPETLPPPWKCDDIAVTVFYVPADQAALMRLCDRCLNAPCGRTQYRPLVDYVALTFQQFTGLHSLALPAADRLTISYRETSFWVIVQDAAQPDRPAEVLIPYIFVDNWLALASGREIIGFPKELADRIQPPVRLASGTAFADSYVEALAAQLPNDRATTQRILTCSPVFGIETDRTLARASRLLELLLSGKLPMVFLREIRAVGGGTDCDIRQLIGAVADPFDIRWQTIRPILTPHRLVLPAVASHPIAADLGLGASPVHIPFGLEFDLSFVVNPGLSLC
jgi:acetoacetate decarboxylase